MATQLTGTEALLNRSLEAAELPEAALSVELTYSCNQACAYCYNPSRATADRTTNDAPRELASTPLIIARLERLIENWRLSQVTLTGGEPLTHPGILDIVSHLRSRALPVQLISNGTLVREAFARRLADLSVIAVQVTLNGADAEAHQEHVGRDSFDEALQGARVLLAHGIPVTGCIVVTRRNAISVGKILKVWQDLGVTTVALSRFSPAGMSLGRLKTWLPKRQDLIEAFSQALPFARAGMQIKCTVPIPGCLLDTSEFAPIGFGTCAIGSRFQEFALGPGGALRLCTLHAGPLAGGRDVLDPTWDLSQVLTSREVADYRTRLPEFCRNCSAAPLCLGGCSASERYQDDGAPRALDPLIVQYFEELAPSRLVKCGHHPLKAGGDP